MKGFNNEVKVIFDAKRYCLIHFPWELRIKENIAHSSYVDSYTLAIIHFYNAPTPYCAKPEGPRCCSEGGNKVIFSYKDDITK